jgi:hypothetical protein
MLTILTTLISPLAILAALVCNPAGARFLLTMVL